MTLKNTRIARSPLSGRINLARFGKDKSVALEVKDVTSDFFQTIVSHAFDGKMPKVEDLTIFNFGGGEEHFEVTVKRVEAEPIKPLI